MKLLLSSSSFLMLFSIMIRDSSCLIVSVGQVKEKHYECGRQMIRSGRIVGGEGTYEGEFPWIVSIQLNGQHYCGGVLINHKWILTAAHCVVGFLPHNFVVRLGAHRIRSKLEPTSNDIQVTSIIIHSNYNRPRPFSNDIALLRLREETKYTDYILPICLPSINDPLVADLYEKKNGIVVGWGWIDDGGEKSNTDLNAEILQKVNLPIISNQDCESWYQLKGKPLVLSSTQFCAGYKQGGKDACRGDSGGPYLIKNISSNSYALVGIVSAGIGCALPNLPGLYTRVDAFIPWIDKYIN